MIAELICMRLADMGRRHPDQDNSRVCSQCSTRVGIYPSGQQALALKPSLKIVCTVCFEEAPPPDAVFLAPGAENEPAESYEHKPK